MKAIVICLLSLILGGWLVFDGCHVLVKGKYFGPPEPGPWAGPVKALGINPFALGFPFIILGLFWLVSAYSLYSRLSWSLTLSSVIAVATLWYLPFGTVISVLVLVLLWVF